MRQNITQEVWAEIFDTSQPVISGIITKFTPLIEASTEEDRPTVGEAKEAAAREQTVLVDGFLAPTWSWRDTPELWSGKHKTTGFNGQVIANLRGDLLFVSEPVTGHNHDMTALAETETVDIIAAAYSGIGDKGYQGSDFITPFKKPQGGELLDWQKEFNAQVNKLRAPVERAIDRIGPRRSDERLRCLGLSGDHARYREIMGRRQLRCGPAIALSRSLLRLRQPRPTL